VWKLRRVRAEAMACANWEAAGRLEQHIVTAEARLDQHRQRVDELAHGWCGRRTDRVSTNAAAASAIAHHDRLQLRSDYERTAHVSAASRR
jgi:hypothetical protein